MRSLDRASIARIGLMLASGMLLAGSFPPFQSAESAWFALVPLILCARLSHPCLAFKLGWGSGLVFWLISLAWLLSMYNAGGPLLLVIVSWLVLAGCCAVYMGVFTALVSVLWRGWAWHARPVPVATKENDPDSALKNIGRLFAIPLLWVGCEYLRSTLWTGFSWNTLGVSQYANLAVVHWAAWGGVYAVSALCALMNAALALTAISVVARIFNRNLAKRVHPELMLGLVICGVSWLMGYLAVREEQAGLDGDAYTRVRVAAIQSNIPQSDKWAEVSAKEILQTMHELTFTAKLSAPELIVWPETSVPGNAVADPVIRTFVSELASAESAILVGTLEAQEKDAHVQYYNSAVLFTDEGPQWPFYRKVHLVPFGEYVPGESLIPALQKLCPIGFSCTAGTSNTVLRLPQSQVPFSVLICFEDTIARLSRNSVKNGARFLVNMTNDAWFEGSWAGWQHMAHCVFRCVENRVPAVRCANLGVSCYISSVGQIDATTRQWLKEDYHNKADYRVDELQISMENQHPTFYNRYGDLPFALPCGTFCGLAFLGLIGRGRFTGVRPERLPVESEKDANAAPKTQE